MSDANSPRLRRKDARRGVAIGVVAAVIIGAIIWCVVHDDPMSGLAACRGRRVRDERDFWRQAADHPQHAAVPDCLYVAEQIIAEVLSPDELRAVRVALRPADPVPVPGFDGDVDQRLPAAGPYRELQLYEYDDESVDPLDVAREITETTGRMATPNYLMVSTQIWKYGSADTAQPTLTTSSIPALLTPAGSQVPATSNPGTVVVVDTGFDVAGLVSAAGVLVKNADKYTSNVTVDTAGPDEVGHGTFIASRIRGATQPSDVPVRVVAIGGLTKSIQLLPNSTEPTMTISDWQFAFAVFYGTQRAVGPGPKNAPTILNLSFGSYGCGKGSSNTAGVVVEGGKFKYSDAAVCATAGVRSALLALKSSGYIDFVTAAAGNDASSSAFFPAAFSEEACFHTTNVAPTCRPLRETSMQSTWLFAVGTNGRLAGQVSYSNNGSFVNVKAKSTLVAGLLPKTATRSLAGYYVWSGTSFAAPCVASFLAVGQEALVRTLVGNKPRNELDCS